MGLKSYIAKWFLDGVIKALQDGKLNWRSRIVVSIAKREVNKIMDGKSKWKSKAVWTAIVGVILAGIQPISSALGHPITVPAWIYELLGGFGIYALRDGQGKPLE